MVAICQHQNQPMGTGDQFEATSTRTIIETPVRRAAHQRHTLQWRIGRIDKYMEVRDIPTTRSRWRQTHPAHPRLDLDR